MTTLITGGAGFIGTNFVYHWRRQHPCDRILVLDALTYAGNRANLQLLTGDSAVTFIKGDICDYELLTSLFAKYDICTVVHFAAESHVDRSIVDPDLFVRTNVVGTEALLRASLRAWKERNEGHRFHHVSTDEVYGSLAPDDPPFTEVTRYDPRSPYAASKAASDFLVRAYGHTYGLPFTISNCSNNYGPFQFPEKIIPLVIINVLSGLPLPIYGDGMNVRDWIHVEDHCAMISTLIERGRLGETYNIGGCAEMANVNLVRLLCELIDDKLAGDADLRHIFPECPASCGQKSSELMTFVKDRPGHDRRYAIDGRKFATEFGSGPLRSLARGLRETIDWYVANESWWRSVQTGEYRQWMAQQYGMAG